MSPSEVSGIIDSPVSEGQSTSDTSDSANRMAEVEVMAPAREERTGTVEQVETMAPVPQDEGTRTMPDEGSVAEEDAARPSPGDTQLAREEASPSPLPMDTETFRTPSESEQVPFGPSQRAVGAPPEMYARSPSATPPGWVAAIQRFFRALFGLFGRR